MDLTPERQRAIDVLTLEKLVKYYDLNSTHVRLRKVPNPWFEGETLDYWQRRMTELREREQQPVGAR